MDESPKSPAGIEGSALKGPFPVGAYAEMLREELRGRSRLQLFGEIWNLRKTTARVYFELRDARGAVPCAIWTNKFEALGEIGSSLSDGAQIVVAGGPDYYPGSKTSSPSFSFDVTALRVAGEGDLLAQLAALRRQLQAEGLFEPQKLLARPQLPRTIGVVTSESGKARDDILAGLQRRGWAGTLVWGFAPVQDRKAAAAITQALTDLAGTQQVETIIVARGGGSLADLFAFCDETLCRTVALLRVPVIASVGHHTDQTLIDDVAAESCSTPTHAAEAAVPLDINAARAALRASTAALSRNAQGAVVGRARALAALARVPGTHIARQRRELHQDARELRAAGQRRLLLERERSATVAEVLRRKAVAGAGPDKLARLRTLEGLSIALTAHDPRGVLERGYALVDDGDGNLITSAAQARAAKDVRLQFADDAVDAKIKGSDG